MKCSSISKRYTSSHYIKLDISSAFASVDRRVLANLLTNTLVNLDVFWSLYGAREFVLNEKSYEAGRGIFVGTRSGHKLFTLLVRRILKQFRTETGFMGNIDFYVDDFLLHCDSFHFMVKEHLVDAFDRACNSFGLSLNRKKVSFFTAEKDKEFTFAGRKIQIDDSKD